VAEQAEQINAAATAAQWVVSDTPRIVTFARRPK
jgi:hypothetical protein